ncbi:electron transport complex subunit RsxC [Miniphocaeibacter massiliensis]|uniref:electron transport complex subunit RsxC n=1 Tax=Miniphocaeibacter massiliensis TaxID=2041841 RepID=UPI000C1C508F|nr:electron transport complex subunit RsxC [Miniphocaeibacter massiliensis]
MDKELTFKGGIHMHDFKEFTNKCEIEEGPSPKFVKIALHQHTGAPCDPLVKVGEEVKVGQKVGDANATITAPVHSSVSGVVKGIEEIITVSGVKTKALVIESNGEEELGFKSYNDDYKNLKPEEIVKRVREAGIVGLGGAGFPTHVKISRNPKDTINHVIVNGAECEPYLTGDQVVMEEYPEKVVIGLDIVLKAMEAKNGYIGIEDNKPGAISKVKEASKNYDNINVKVLKTKYPQGDQRRLIDSVLNMKMPASLRSTEEGVQVINSSTAAAIYDAVVLGKPLYEKVVTVTGSAIANPKNILVKVGTSIKEILEFCGGFKEEPGKIIIGGPMMGEAQFTIESPTLKANGGIIVMNKEEAKPPVVSPCIKCGKCVDVCPALLLPLYLEQNISHNLFEEANKLNVMDCIECGSCSYVCPSKRPLVESIRHGKRELRATESKK